MKNETFLLNFQNKWSFLQLQSHINPVLLRLLGCILPTCQLCKSYFAQTSGMASSTASQRYFALFESSSCFRPETRPRRHQKRFLSVINCLQFRWQGIVVYDGTFFASANLLRWGLWDMRLERRAWVWNKRSALTKQFCYKMKAKRICVQLCKLQFSASWCLGA